MNKRNYQKEMEDLIKELQKEGKVPSLLLHSCCAPCSSYVLEYLSDYFRITVLYYNPNIFPESEYKYRIEEQRRLIQSLPVRYRFLLWTQSIHRMIFTAGLKDWRKKKKAEEDVKSVFA